MIFESFLKIIKLKKDTVLGINIFKVYKKRKTIFKYICFNITFKNISLDMAVQNCIGDAFRGATWVALHNGGGVGW